MDHDLDDLFNIDDSDLFMGDNLEIDFGNSNNTQKKTLPPKVVTAIVETQSHTDTNSNISEEPKSPPKIKEKPKEMPKPAIKTIKPNEQQSNTIISQQKSKPLLSSQNRVQFSQSSQTIKQNSPKINFPSQQSTKTEQQKQINKSPVQTSYQQPINKEKKTFSQPKIQKIDQSQRTLNFIDKQQSQHSLSPKKSQIDYTLSQTSQNFSQSQISQPNYDGRNGLLSCTELPSKKRRRIPGPAGAIGDNELNSSDSSIPRKKQKLDNNNHNDKVSLIGNCSVDEINNKEIGYNHDFNRGPWLSMLKAADLPPFFGK